MNSESACLDTTDVYRYSGYHDPNRHQISSGCSAKRTACCKPIPSAMKNRNLAFAFFGVLSLLTNPAYPWAPPLRSSNGLTKRQRIAALSRLDSFVKDKEATTTTDDKSLEQTTEKYGLEVGLFESLKSGNTESAQSLLKRYGIAYLATSIPLALVSFALCYVLVSNGVDVAGLLSKIFGVEASNTTSETAGTVAIAYAAHKAASPLRFPPTVALTPVVAKLIGREPEEEGE